MVTLVRTALLGLALPVWLFSGLAEAAAQDQGTTSNTARHVRASLDSDVSEPPRASPRIIRRTLDDLRSAAGVSEPVQVSSPLLKRRFRVSLDDDSVAVASRIIRVSLDSDGAYAPLQIGERERRLVRTSLD